MKKFIVSILMLGLVTSVAIAQPERIGAGLTFYQKRRFGDGDTGNPGIVLKSWIMLDKEKRMHIVPSVSAYNKLVINHISHLTSTYLFQGDLDFQYNIFREKSLKGVVTGGVNYTHILSRVTPVISIPEIPSDSAMYGFGPTVGAFLEMRMDASWDFIVGGKYSFSGLRFNSPLSDKMISADLASLIIQVQAVYYFRPRPKGTWR